MSNYNFNIAAGGGGLENIKANKRYIDTATYKQRIKEEIKKNLPHGYDCNVTFSFGVIFTWIIQKLIIILGKAEVTILVTVREYNLFITALERMPNIKIIKHDFQYDIGNIKWEVEDIDVMLISPISYDCGMLQDIRRIVAPIREQNSQLIIIGDMAQVAGVELMDIEVFDLLLFSMHKWLAQPWGLGLAIHNTKKNILNEVVVDLHLHDGILYRELDHVVKSLDSLTERIFKKPITSNAILCKSMEMMPHLLRKLGSRCKPIDQAIYEGQTAVFPLIDVVDAEYGYKKYRELLEDGYAIKFLKDLKINGTSSSYLRVTYYDC